MSGIYAAQINADAGTLINVSKVAKRNSSRGRDAHAWVYLDHSSVWNRGLDDIKLPRPKEQIYTYRVVGQHTAAPSQGLKGVEIGPYTNNWWTIAIDGAVSNATPEEVVTQLMRKTWKEVMTRLTGQFAIVGMDSNNAFLYYAVKAKPLYMLNDPLGRGVIISSDPDAFFGLYHPTRNPQPVQLGPYEYGEVGQTGSLNIEHWPQGLYEGTLMLCGGGLDSLVAARDIQKSYPSEDIVLLYVDYGAKAAEAEKRSTRSIAAYLNDHGKDAAVTRSLEITSDFFRRYTQSPLTSSQSGITARPTRGQATEWVPARNTVLMSLALALAETNGMARIVTGINQTAASAYPDNDWEWWRRFQDLAPFALNNRTIYLEAPLANLTKTEIVRLGSKLRIPFSKVESWSCYDSGPIHCGVCSSCIARRLAFHQARVTDPTEYKA